MIPACWNISGFWKYRLTHMNLHRHARALEATHGQGREGFEIAMDLSLRKAEAGDQRQSWFWWKVANELIRIRQRRALAAEMVKGMRFADAKVIAVPATAAVDFDQECRAAKSRTRRTPARRVTSASIAGS
ncbi:MAG: hypothetical protein ACRC7C_01670 [Beijerinckiaceae bacterium]